MINSIYFPNELFYIILSNCDGFERENMRLVCKLFNNFKLDSTHMNHPEKYREVLKIKNIEKLFEHHHEDLIRIYTKNHPDEIRNIFLYSCKYGWINMVEETMQSLSNYWNKGMYHACRGGHIDIIKLMIEKAMIDGSEMVQVDGSEMVRRTIDLNHLQSSLDANDWNRGMYNACSGGHIDIVKLMIENGANNWNRGMYCACNGGHIDIVKLMMEKAMVDGSEMVRGTIDLNHLRTIDHRFFHH